MGVMIRSFPPHLYPVEYFVLLHGASPHPSGERVGHSSPQQSWGVFWNILIKPRNKISLIVSMSRTTQFICSPPERLPHRLGLILRKWMPSLLLLPFSLIHGEVAWLHLLNATTTMRIVGIGRQPLLQFSLTPYFQFNTIVLNSRVRMN